MEEVVRKVINSTQVDRKEDGQMAIQVEKDTKADASDTNSVITKKANLGVLSDVPLEGLTKSVFESINALDLIDKHNPDLVKDITGLDEEERKKYRESLISEEVDKLFTKVNKRIGKLKKKGRMPVDLNEEEIAAILLYTREAITEYAIPIYRIINSSLLKRDEDKIKKAGPYIVNLLLALRKLDLYKGDILYRGMNCVLDKQNMSVGHSLFWPGFTSTTHNQKIAKDFAMRGDDIPGGGHYIFEIQGNSHGYDISKISGYKEEGKPLLQQLSKFYPFFLQRCFLNQRQDTKSQVLKSMMESPG